MAVVRYPIKLNVKPSSYPLIRQITLVQGDTANIFAIELQESKQPFNIENCHVTATFKKADENVVVLEGNVVDAKNGLVDIPIYSQVVAYPGKVYCTIEVYNMDNLRLTSIMFEFNVVEQLGNDEVIESTTEYTILQELITDVQSIKVEEEQRVVNENIRIQNEIDRQTVFDGIVNTANTTKDGLDASIIDANNVKSLLDHSITSGNDIKANLDTSIDNAESIMSDLNTNIDEGNQLKIDLLPLVDNANTSKTNLDTAITNANTKKAELDGSISTANTTKTELDTSITNANNINDTLSNPTTGNIKKATDINDTLNSSINTANTSKTNLDTSISNSTTAKTNLDNSISTANITKTALDGSIIEGNILKGELDDIIVGTDFEQVITDLSNLKQDQHNHNNKEDVLDNLSDDNGKLKYRGQDVGVGDMTKAEYDADNDGKIDMANDSERLGGQLPDYYATKTDIPDISGKADKSYVDSELDSKVDNSRVLTDVPANAKFTDTITTINGKTGVIEKEDITALGIPAQDTTYDVATTDANGLMSATDKTKLNGIEAGANKTTISNTLTSTSTTQALSANQGKVLNDKINILNTDLIELEYSELSSIAMNIDDEGIYQNIEWKRKDNTIYAKSTLIGTYPYNQIKIDYYDEVGTTIIKTITWDLTYDYNDFPYVRMVV